MTRENSLQSTYHDVMARTSEYTAGKRLDTESSLNGDTVLSTSAIDGIDNDAITTVEGELRSCFDEMSQIEDLDAKIRAELIRRRLAEMAFIKAAHAQVTGEVDKSAEIHDIQKSLHDHYSPALFQAALKRKIELLEAISIPGDMEIARALLLDELDGYVAAIKLDTTPMELERPKDETLQVIGDWLHDQFGDIFDEIDMIEADELDAWQMAEILNMAIVTTPALRDNGWLAKTVQRHKRGASVAASSRSMVVSQHDRFLKSRAKRLVVHEVFGHALRSGIAETNGNKIGATGTASYSRFEESFELVLEQCLEGSYDPKRGIDHYVTIGLAETVGLSRDNIAHLTESMHQIMLADGGLNPKKLQEIDVLTKKQIGRTFAGLTDVDDGIAYRKDINYLHGLNGAWRLLNAIVEADQVDEGMRWLLSAKFNPYEANDVLLANQYNAAPSSIKDALAVQ